MAAKVSRDNALAALVSMPTIKDAADLVGVSPKTMHAWMREPAFKASLARLQGEMVGEATRRVLQAVGAAVDALSGIVADVTCTPAARVLAARTLLDYVGKHGRSLEVSCDSIDMPRIVFDFGSDPDVDVSDSP